MNPPKTGDNLAPQQQMHVDQALEPVQEKASSGQINDRPPGAWEEPPPGDFSPPCILDLSKLPKIGHPISIKGMSPPPDAQ